jgi:hypothetical protein
MSDQAALLFDAPRERENGVHTGERHDAFDTYTVNKQPWEFSFSETDVQEAVSKAEEEQTKDIAVEQAARRRESSNQRRRASDSLMKRLEKDLNRGETLSATNKDEEAFKFLTDLDHDHVHASTDPRLGIKAGIKPIDMWNTWEYIHSQSIKRGSGGASGPGAVFQLLQWTLNTQEDDLFDFSHPYLKDFLVGEYLFRECGFAPGHDGINTGSEAAHYQFSHGATICNRSHYDTHEQLHRRTHEHLLHQVTDEQLKQVNRMKSVLARLLTVLHGDGSLVTHRRNVQRALFDHPEHFMAVQMVQQLFRHVPVPLPFPKDCLADSTDDIDFVAEVLKKYPEEEEVEAMFNAGVRIKRIRCGLYASVAVGDVVLGLGDCAYALTDEHAIDMAAAGHHEAHDELKQGSESIQRVSGDDGSLRIDGSGQFQYQFSLQGQKMGAPALWTLSMILQGNSSLQILDLSGCSIDASTTLAFANAMFYCSTEQTVASHVDEMYCKKTAHSHYKNGADSLTKLLPLLQLVGGKDGDRAAAAEKAKTVHDEKRSGGESATSGNLHCFEKVITQRSEYLTILPAHAAFPSLHTLKLSNNPLTDNGSRQDGITALVRCLFTTKNKAEPMSYALPDCSGLDNLDPHGIFPAMGGELCVCTPCLCELDLSNTGVDATVLQFLAESVMSAAKAHPGGSESYPLRVLSLGMNFVTLKGEPGVGVSQKGGKKQKLEYEYRGLETLMLALKLVQVERLRLECNGIDPTGLSTIAEGLSFKQRLREITLSGNVLLGRTATMKEAKGAITKANCAGLAQFMGSLSSSSSRILSLEGCSLGIEGAATIGKNILQKGIGLLTCLDLAGNGIGAKGAKSLFDALMTADPEVGRAGTGILHTLDLSKNELGPEGARAIATATKAAKGKGGLRGLRSLGLAFNDLVGRGGQFSQMTSSACQDFDALGELVKSFGDVGCAWEQLEHVDLSMNRLGYEGSLVLAQEPVARALGSLLSVDLSDNEFFDQGSVILAQSLHHVHTLMINEHFDKGWQERQRKARKKKMGKGALKGILKGITTGIGSVFGAKRGAEKRHAEEAALKHQVCDTLVLTVKITQATGLPGVDSNGLSDPFVKLHVGNNSHKELVTGGVMLPTRARTKTVSDTITPKFNETFKLAVVNNKLPLEIVVMDYDAHGGNDYMCHATIDLSGIEVGAERKRDWYELSNEDEGSSKYVGRIELDLQLDKATEDLEAKDEFGITLVRATGLAAADRPEGPGMGGTSDPYCVMSYNRFKLGKTKMVTDDLCPEWDHELDLPWSQSCGDYLVKFEVFDYDPGENNQDDFLGGVYLTVQELMQYGETNGPIAFDLTSRPVSGRSLLRPGSPQVHKTKGEEMHKTKRMKKKTKSKGHKKRERPKSGCRRVVQGQIWLDLQPPMMELLAGGSRYVLCSPPSCSCSPPCSPPCSLRVSLPSNHTLPHPPHPPHPHPTSSNPMYRAAHPLHSLSIL